MNHFKKLLDAVVAGLGRPEQSRSGSAEKGTPWSSAPDGGGESGRSREQLLQRARDLAAQRPGLTQAALLGLAGLMLGRKRKGVTANLATLGGLAVIGGLAYKAFQGWRIIPSAGTEGGQAATGVTLMGAETNAPEPDSRPEKPLFHPISYTEDDAMLFLRTMVAAAASDGRIDAEERARIIKGLTEAGIDPQASHWFDDEMASPADVDEIAESVNDPDRAAQVYAAARIAVDPDTVQERDFLHRLAEALDLDPAVRAQIDETADALR